MTMSDAELKAWRSRQRIETVWYLDARMVTSRSLRPGRDRPPRPTLVDLSAWRRALTRPDPDRTP